MKCLFIPALFLLACSAFASTEIFRCVDNDGHVSFGDKPCPIESVNGNTQAHLVWRKMLPMIQEGLKVYSHIGPDFYSIRSCMDQSENFSKKLSDIARPLHSLSYKKHTNMFRAMEDLKECGKCRVSAPNYCERASNYLITEMNVLTAL